MKSMAKALVLAIGVGGCASVSRNEYGVAKSNAVTEVSQAFVAKPKWKIAVLPFKNSGKNGTASDIADTLSTHLMGMGFRVVERTQLEAVFSELKLNMSGAISASELKRAGEMAGVDLLVFGTASYEYVPEHTYMAPKINSYTGKYSGQVGEATGAYHTLDGETAKFVDVESGEILINSFCNEKPRSKSFSLDIANSIQSKLISLGVLKKPAR
ncbi:MAG: CsgG/HfaB family protein [Elusimicrobiota bacterium]